MTKRFVLLLCGGLPVLILISPFSSDGALIFFLLYNAVVLSLFVADMFISPKESVIAIERDENDKLYFKTENIIEFKVRNKFTRPLTIELKDEIPDYHFEIVKTDMLQKIEPGGKQTLRYELIPKKRGSFLFKNIYVRYDGVLGLCRKYFTLAAPKDYKVYPNLKNVSKYRLIIQKHRLLSHGQRRIRLKGQGSEFESLREYVEGDDYRRVNWMATARENKLIMNQYEAEKNQPVYVLLDTGRSMSYSIKGYKKLDYAINAALVLSDIVSQKGDNSGLMVFNTDVLSIIPPGKGESHRNALMDALYHVEDTKMASDYSGAFFELVSIQKRRSIVFIFTDFETTEEAKELMAAIPVLSKRHIPVIVLMVNESLEKIASSGGTGVRAAYNEAMAESLILERRKIIRALNQRGILCVESHAENFAIDTINQYLVLKEKFFG